MHHLLNNKAEVNQRDEKGMTPLHRAAFLAQYDGYLELYEYLLVSLASTDTRVGQHSGAAARRRPLDTYACRSGLLDCRNELLCGPF